MGLRTLVFPVAEYVRAHPWARWSLRAMPVLAIFSLFVVTGALAKTAAGVTFVK